MKFHPSHIGEKLGNFNFGMIKEVASQNLDKAGDFFVIKYRSDILGLNRFEVLN